MAVICAKCGEELLGAINRCWRCGTEYESRSGKIDVPPRRRAPISGALTGAVEAMVIENPVAGDIPADQAASATDAQSPASPSGPIRRGSPFRPRELVDEGSLVTGEPPVGAAARITQYPKNLAASVGSMVAIILGLFSMGVAYPIPLAGIITAAVGLGMGIWGLGSKRRKAAIFGLLLCCAAITLSGFFGAVQVHRTMHGVAPWEAPIYPAP